MAEKEIQIEQMEMRPKRQERGRKIKRTSLRDEDKDS